MKLVWAEKTDLSVVKEREEAAAWLERIKGKNLIDPDVLTYPATALLKATDGERNYLHVPIQRAFIVESLGISPENSPLDTARALYGVMQIVRYESKNNGQGEIYFLCSDEQTMKFAEHNGFERVNIPLFRMKVL